MSTELFPTFLKLAGRPVLVVGGGPVAASKLASLLAAGAEVTVVAPDVVAEIERSGVRIERRAFAESDLDGAWFVVAAAPPEVNRQVARPPSSVTCSSTPWTIRRRPRRISAAWSGNRA